jgi:hypothetical protein
LTTDRGALEGVVTIAPRTIVGVGYDPARIAAGNGILKRHGFNVVTATSIPAALAACAALHVDAVVVGRSVSRNSAQLLISRLRRDGGPPVMYLGSDDTGEFAQNVPDQKKFFNQQFLRMLRTILLPNRTDQSPSASVALSSEFRNLRIWWLASLIVLAVLITVFVSTSDADFVDAVGFFTGLTVCVLCAVACLRSQLHVVEKVHEHGINADVWYPRIALGIALLLPGILLEVGWFLLSVRRQVHHQVRVT